MALSVIRRLAAIALLTGLCFAETLRVELASPDVVKTRLESGEVKLRERQRVIKGLFTEAGCDAEEQPIDKRYGNVICTLPGATSSTIIVGAHFDFVDQGRGLVDDWSGTSLLPSLYQALKTLPRQHTYKFVAFASEEKGLVGSRLFVKKLSSAQRTGVRAFVNLECLGMAPPKVWRSRSTPELVQRLLDVAAAVGV